MKAPDLKSIEIALRHPMDFVSFPPLPGESQSSHRTRLQVHSLHRLIREHNPESPLPDTRLEPRTQTRQTIPMSTETQAPEAAQNPTLADLMAALSQMNSRLNKIQGRGPGRPKGPKKEKKSKRPLKNKKGIGGAIEALRLQAKLTQTELAKKIGAIHHSNISFWESHDNLNIKSNLLTKVAGVFGLTASQLLAKSEERDSAAAQS